MQRVGTPTIVGIPVNRLPLTAEYEERGQTDENNDMWATGWTV